ncbi:MAG TPA: protein-methionine-sulfoxide reductase heme-binding subunit MsrQ [Longimicrobiaceae bacterium]|nr:protein-methionine-sulfoxide reductase heme-binding subunit MsrQ [Longimicrobiaceae bacterium]
MTLRIERLKPVVWIAALAPFALLVYDAFTGGLGAEPIEEITHRTGKTALVLLLVTLAVTPVRRVTGWNGAVRLRRLLGLFAFFYASLHFLTYLFDQELSPAYIVEDVVEHPYVTAGFTAFLLLIPLAATSTQGMIRRLGKRWQKLHRLVYVAAGLGVVHFLWLVKKDLREPLIFGAVLLLLLAFRLPFLSGGRKTARAVRRRPGPALDRKRTAWEASGPDRG